MNFSLTVRRIPCWCCSSQFTGVGLHTGDTLCFTFSLSHSQPSHPHDSEIGINKILRKSWNRSSFLLLVFLPVAPPACLADRLSDRLGLDLPSNRASSFSKPGIYLLGRYPPFAWCQQTGPQVAGGWSFVIRPDGLKNLRGYSELLDRKQLTLIVRQ